MLTSDNSKSKLRILIAMGTRPEIIKMAPLVWKARLHKDISTIVCHSGQHSDLADPMLEYFDIRPDIHLHLLQQEQTLANLFSRCVAEFDMIFQQYKPQVAVVQGDTATCAAVSLAAFYTRIPVVHVEAGLRTGDLQSPWPEEFNRRLATLAADLHCVPTERARKQLQAEGVADKNILLSGNTVVDALKWTLARQSRSTAATTEQKPLVVLTAHRRENFGQPLESICRAVLQLSEKFADHRFVFITHPNPNAGPVVRSILDGHSRVEVLGPMDYPGFVGLLSSAKLIISDSGGIQEEAPTLGVPLLVTRATTERPEAVECGAAELIGTDETKLVNRAAELLSVSAPRSKKITLSPFGDGSAGQIIINAIADRYR